VESNASTSILQFLLLWPSSPHLEHLYHHTKFLVVNQREKEEEDEDIVPMLLAMLGYVG